MKEKDFGTYLLVLVLTSLFLVLHFNIKKIERERAEQARENIQQINKINYD